MTQLTVKEHDERLKEIRGKMEFIQLSISELIAELASLDLTCYGATEEMIKAWRTTNNAREAIAY